jgi:tetratricopeptide (TPR) repeat protein
LLEC